MESQQCRLCLQWMEDPIWKQERVVDVFAPRFDSYTNFDLKIRDFLGVYITPDDDIRMICRNCEQTIILMDEFRTLCLQTDEVYQSIRIHFEDSANWLRYQHDIRQLRLLLAEKLNVVNEALSNVSLKQANPKELDSLVVIKEEGQEGKQRGHDETLDASNLLNVEMGKLESALNLNESSSKSILSVKRDYKYQLKMIIAQGMQEQLVSSQGQSLDWVPVADMAKLSVSQAQKIWNTMKNYYKKQKPRAPIDAICQSCPLFAILHEIVPAMEEFDSGEDIDTPPKSTPKPKRKPIKKIAPFKTRTQKIALAKEITNHEIIWSRDHPDYGNLAEREKVWRQIGAVFKVSSSVAKQVWKGLRDRYRSQTTQGTNEDQGDDLLYIDPLISVLKPMLEAYIPHKKTKDSNASKMVFLNEDRIKLAQVCFGHELLWKSQHPDFNSTQKQDAIWGKIAVQFDITSARAKMEWKRLRDVYRNRQLRLSQGTLNKNHRLIRDPLYRLLERMFREPRHAGDDGNRQEPGQDPNEELEYLEADGKPFKSHEERSRLAEEIAKHEVVWNPKHPDYGKAVERGTAWKEIAAVFGCEWRVVSTEFNRFLRRARCVHASSNEIDKELLITDPLHLMLDRLGQQRYADTLNEAECSDSGRKRKIKKEPTDVSWIPKRRYSGKRVFDNIAGCIKVERNGVVRYEKICELCGKQIERSYFEYHMNSHYGLKPYACSVAGCDKQYGNKTTRDRHEVIYHGDDYKMECDQCGEKFKQRHKFEYHYAINHKSEEIPCPICGKLQKHKVVLKEHIRRHSGRFVCNVCGKVLQKKYSLNVHMRTHTQEKPYPCELCDQRFMLKVQMKTHLSKVHGVLLEELHTATTSIM